MSSDQTLSDLTASLVQELARSAAAADRSQRDEWVALAAEISVPLEEYCARAAEPSRVAEVMKTITGASPKSSGIPAARLNALFGDRWKAATRVPRQEVEAAVVEKLRHDAAARHRDIAAMLRTRLPKVEIARASIDAKVLLRHSPAGVVATLATSDSVKSGGGNVSTIHLELNVGAFPAFDTSEIGPSAGRNAGDIAQST